MNRKLLIPGLGLLALTNVSSIRADIRQDGRNCGKTVQKVDACSRIIASGRNAARAYLYRGIAYLRIWQNRRAIADFDRAIHLKMRSAGIFNARGIAYSRLLKFRRAIWNYNKAISLKPLHHLAYNNRGYAYFLLRQYQCAIDDFNRALVIKPKYVKAIINRRRAQAFLAKRHRHKAEKRNQTRKCIGSKTKPTRGAVLDYLRRVQRHLRSNKSYPKAARDGNIGGEVVIKFVVDRTGRVLDHRVYKSSGYKILDTAAIRTLLKSTPLPPFPPQIKRRAIVLTFRLHFRRSGKN